MHSVYLDRETTFAHDRTTATGSSYQTHADVCFFFSFWSTICDCVVYVIVWPYSLAIFRINIHFEHSVAILYVFLVRCGGVDMGSAFNPYQIVFAMRSGSTFHCRLLIDFHMDEPTITFCLGISVCFSRLLVFNHSGVI